MSTHAMPIARVFCPLIAQSYDQVSGRQMVKCQCVCAWVVKQLLLFEQGPVRRESLAVALAVDHDLAAGAGEPVEGAVAEEWIVEQAESLLDGAIGGDCAAGGSVAGDDQFVEVDRLPLVERGPSDVGRTVATVVAGQLVDLVAFVQRNPNTQCLGTLHARCAASPPSLVTLQPCGRFVKRPTFALQPVGQPPASARGHTGL